MALSISSVTDSQSGSLMQSSGWPEHVMDSGRHSSGCCSLVLPIDGTASWADSISCDTLSSVTAVGW